MAAKEEKNQNPLPLVLIHRKQSFNIESLSDRLSQHFSLLDPHHQSPEFPPSLRRSVRAVVIFGPYAFTAEDIQNLPALELAVTTSAGSDHIDFEACRRRGISVAGIGDSFTDNVADFAVALLIDVFRRVSTADQFVRSGSWPVQGHFPLGSKLRGKRVGIVGLGKIGSAVAKRLTAFGCKIAYTSRSHKPSSLLPFFPTTVALASHSDALVACCALTEETRHIIGREALTALSGQHKIVVNVGRGALVDERELVGFLERGEIAGAGLDVFENEPEVSRELLKMVNNVVLTPHAAVVTPEAIEDVTRLVLDNLNAFFSGEPLVSPIQF